MATATSGLAGIDQSKFLQLLIAGMRNQDPLQPGDSQQFLAQLSQFASMESMQSLNAQFGQMLRLQQLTDGASLLGKTVRYAVGSSENSGQVTRVSVSNGKVVLDIGAIQVPLDEVRSVMA